MVAQQAAVEVNIRHRHHSLKLHLNLLATKAIRGPEMLPVPGDETEHVGVKSLVGREDIGVGHGDTLKRVVVKGRLLGARKVLGNKHPVGRKIKIVARRDIEAAAVCSEENG